MNVLRTTTLIALLTLIQSVQAQEHLLNNPSAKTEVNTVAAQISSPTNYALLQPIAAKPVSATNLLQPKSRPLVPIIQKAASTSKQPDTLSGHSIEVTPLSFKSGEFDHHSFRVHNPTTKNLEQAKVLLKAPAGSMVQQVIPKPDSVDGASILFTVGDMVPGEVRVIEVLIEYPHNELARFESIVLSEEWGNADSRKTRKATPNVTAALKPISSEDLNASTMLKPRVPAMKVSAVKSLQVEKDYSEMLSSNVRRLAKEPEVELASKNEIASAAVSVPELDGFAGIESSLHGPSTVEVGEEVEFSIKLNNQTGKTAGTVVVQLSIPQRMKVTVLDRAAWYDGEQNLMGSVEPRSWADGNNSLQSKN